ncbi:MAG TPA: hypothetical protein VFN43_10115 [Humibacillus sp.]|nr:hypothetical protein [Humibacillus sp.]
MDESDRPTPATPPDDALDPEHEPIAEPFDAAVDSRVRSLLADAAETGPMPAEVSERIAAALADEARLRVGRGPLPDTQDAPVADMAGVAAHVPLARRRQPRPWVAVAAVAAAAAVVAVGASALHVTQRPNPAAVVVGDTRTVEPTATSGGRAAPHIQLSTTDYDASTLGAKARALLDHPATPLHDLAAESPSLGPIATPVGLASCLDAMAVGPGDVTVDLATFDGAPAAIIVVTQAGTSTAYAVGRSCSPGNVTALAGATPVP